MNTRHHRNLRSRERSLATANSTLWPMESSIQPPTNSLTQAGLTLQRTTPGQRCLPRSRCSGKTSLSRIRICYLGLRPSPGISKVIQRGQKERKKEITVRRNNPTKLVKGAVCCLLAPLTTTTGWILRESLSRELAEEPTSKVTTKNQVQQQPMRSNSNFQNCADGTVEERNSTTMKKPIIPETRVRKGNDEGRRRSRRNYHNPATNLLQKAPLAKQLSRDTETLPPEKRCCRSQTKSKTSRPKPEIPKKRERAPAQKENAYPKESIHQTPKRKVRLQRKTQKREKAS